MTSEFGYVTSEAGMKDGDTFSGVLESEVVRDGDEVGRLEIGVKPGSNEQEQLVAAHAEILSLRNRIAELEVAIAALQA
jgi:hypothetical protein